MDIDILKLACSEIEKELAADPTLILNESELQAILQLKLLQLLPEQLPATLASGTLKRGHHPELFVPRVFRELKLDAGRAAVEADIVVLTNSAQRVVPKANGAPKGFRGPFAAIIETKIDTPMAQLLAGAAGPSALKAVQADFKKWETHLGTGLIPFMFSVILTPRPERYANQSNILAIRHCADGVKDWQSVSPELNAQNRNVAKNAATAATLILHAHHKQFPLSLLREKDFETRLLADLRQACTWRSALRMPNGRIVQASPVRSQWTGSWADLLGMRRRHDIVVLRADGLGLHTELELKTSHSDSHNWFRKAEVEGEMRAIQTLIQRGALDHGAFVMYRYGKAMWSADANALASRYKSVDFQYFCA